MTGLFYTIILLGAIQGIITGFLLFFAKKPSLSNRLLAFVIWLIALPGIHLYAHYQDWFAVNKLTQVIHAVLPLVVIMPIGPLIYFYIRALLDPGFRLTSRDRLHFLPVVIDLFPKAIEIFFLIGSAAGWLATNAAPWTQFVNTYSQYADIPRWISMTLYLVWAMRRLRDYRVRLNGSAQTATLRWLRVFTRAFLGFQVIWLLYLVPYVMPRYSDRLINTVDWFPVYIPMAILIYWLGLRGFILSQQVAGSSKKNTASPSLPRRVIEDSLARLRWSMEEEKLYLNPELNLSQLSQHTGLAAKTISAVLNQYLKTSFNEFVNTYRLEEFKRRMHHPGMGHLTIAGMALECGFNSPATFQRTFKQIMGISPTEFRKNAIAMR